MEESMMTQDLKESNTLTAAHALRAEYERLSTDAADLEVKLAAVQALKAKTLRSYNAVVDLLSPDELDRIGRVEVKPIITSPGLHRAAPAASALLERIKSNVQKTWRVEELQEFLANKGEQVSEKYASNTLKKLFDQGLIQRLGRGKYRANNTILGVTGLDEEDYQ
jgi:hypothetical protein